jgi:hypothetical protein
LFYFKFSDEETVVEAIASTSTANVTVNRKKRKTVGHQSVDTWNTESDRDSYIPSMSFRPSPQVGFQLPATENKWSAYNLFSMFLSQQILQVIVNNTNAYAARLTTKLITFCWSKLLTVREFLAFISIIYFMGLVDVPNIKDYWKHDNFFGQDFVRQSGMSRSRFLNILAALHISDLDEDAENDRKKKSGKQYDPLFKVKPLLNEIEVACHTFYNPGQDISIDERMVASKGRFGMKQYIKDKPVKWGFKLWVLACSKTGYTYKFDVYIGKSLTKSDNGLGYDVVMHLMDGLFNQGYRLYVDNFYSSPKLFQDLYKKGCYATGTVRDNRKGMPVGFGSCMPKKANRGTIRWFRKDNLVFVKWKDTREVTALSTYFPATGDTTVSRNTKVDGKYAQISVPIPPLIASYNKGMGGVDLSDQLVQSYHVL